MTTCLGNLFIRFTARAFRKLLSICVFSNFPFGFEGRMWELIVSLLIFLLLIKQHSFQVLYFLFLILGISVGITVIRVSFLPLF